MGWCVPRRSTGPTPVLRPEEPAAAQALPAAVPLMAALGLAILIFCALPAAHAQRRLERDHARVALETRKVEQRVERLERELRSGTQQRYLRIKATRTLLHRGAEYIQQRDARLEQRGR